MYIYHFVPFSGLPVLAIIVKSSYRKVRVGYPPVFSCQNPLDKHPRAALDAEKMVNMKLCKRHHNELTERDRSFASRLLVEALTHPVIGVKVLPNSVEPVDVGVVEEKDGVKA